MYPKDAEGIANSVDPDQTGSALFAQTCLSKNLGTLQWVLMSYMYNTVLDIHEVTFNVWFQLSFKGKGSQKYK